MALPPPAPAGGMMAGGGAPPPDPMAAAGPDPDAGGDAGDTVVCTICKAADGSYVVYAGDEPENDDSGPDMSEDDADVMGDAGAGSAGAPMGGAAGSDGQPASSIGAALKEAMTILQADASSGSGSADDQFAAGFGASKAPTPVGMGG